MANIIQSLFSSDALVDVTLIPSTLNCSGIVTAMEFCYASGVDDTPYGREFELFRLLILEQQNGLTFRITNTIDGNTTPTTQICTDRSFTGTNTIRFCCDRLTFNTIDQFRLPAPNFAFGITSDSIVNHLRHGISASKRN